MSNVSVIEPRPKSITLTMADKFGMEPNAFEATVRATCMKPDKNGRVPTREEFAAFLLVAKEYDLNPLTREIHAFASKGGGIVPIVSVDGWLKLLNSHPQYDGMELTDINDEKGELTAVTCSLWRKDRSRPVTLTEYLKECIRDTEPWKMRHRMLRHKALIQTARYAFGFAGIYDQDEAERIVEAIDVTPTIPTPPTPPKIEPAAPEIPADALTDFDAFHKALDSCPTIDALNAMFEALTKNMSVPDDLEEAQARLREVAAKFGDGLE